MLTRALMNTLSLHSMGPPEKMPEAPDGPVEEPPKPNPDSPVDEPPDPSKGPTKEPPAGPDDVQPVIRDPRVPGQPQREQLD